MVTALFAAYLSIQRPLQSIVPDKRNPPTCIARCEQFRSIFTQAYVTLGLNSNSTTLPDQAVQSIDSPVTVLGGNLLDRAPLLVDDLFQIIICHGVIVDSDLLRAC